MKEKRKVSVDPKQGIIIMRWFVIWILYGLIVLIGPYLFGIIAKQDIFKAYYQQFGTQLLLGPVLIVGLIGLLVNEFIYFFNSKKYRVAIISIIIIGGICGISYKFLQNSLVYKYYKDLHYVMEGTYCENVQSLSKIYSETNFEGRAKVTRIFVKTTDFNFDVGRDIVQVEDYEKFKVKFNEIEKVKIGYLPNSNRLLYIEPVTDEKAKK